MPGRQTLALACTRAPTHRVRVDPGPSPVQSNPPHHHINTHTHIYCSTTPRPKRPAGRTYGRTVGVMKWSMGVARREFQPIVENQFAFQSSLTSGLRQLSLGASGSCDAAAGVSSIHDVMDGEPAVAAAAVETGLCGRAGLWRRWRWSRLRLEMRRTSSSPRSSDEPTQRKSSVLGFLWRCSSSGCGPWGCSPDDFRRLLGCSMFSRNVADGAANSRFLRFFDEPAVLLLVAMVVAVLPHEVVLVVVLEKTDVDVDDDDDE